MFLSCSKDHNKESIDWNEELIGIGFLYVHPDSLNILFSYNENPPLKTYHEQEFFLKNTTLSGDTLNIPNYRINPLFKTRNTIKADFDDSTYFRLEKDSSHLTLIKVIGRNIVPDTLYFKKSPTSKPRSLNYFNVSGFDLSGSYFIEIFKEDSINVWLKGSNYRSYFYEQIEFNETDLSYINSFLNLAIKNRYETMRFENFSIQGASQKEIFVYNDSVFEYDDSFLKYPTASMLVSYFRSKITLTEHRIENKNDLMELRPPFKTKRFSQYPVAVKPYDYTDKE